MTRSATTRILIADDHDDVRAGLRATLGAQPGWTIVAEAVNGRQAVELAAETCPDVVVMDYRMPVLNGIDATRSIRAASPETEVLIFTLHASQHLIRRMLEAGARGYLTKSEARRLLIAAVASLARHEPFFTARMHRDLLNEWLAKPALERE